MAAFGRYHYEMLTATLRKNYQRNAEAHDTVQTLILRSVIFDIADMLEADNKGFKRDMFIERIISPPSTTNHQRSAIHRDTPKE